MTWVLAMQTGLIRFNVIRLFNDYGTRCFLAFNDIRGFTLFVRRFRHVPLLKVVQNDRSGASANAFRNCDRLNDQDEDRVGIRCVPTRARRNASCCILSRLTESTNVAPCRSFIAFCDAHLAGRNDVD